VTEWVPGRAKVWLALEDADQLWSKVPSLSQSQRYSREGFFAVEELPPALKVKLVSVSPEAGVTLRAAVTTGEGDVPSSHAGRRRKRGSRTRARTAGNLGIMAGSEGEKEALVFSFCILSSNNTRRRAGEERMACGPARMMACDRVHEMAWGVSKWWRAAGCGRRRAAGCL
jgi:hypothetical protein